MILHLGERVYWGAPQGIYLEGVITRLDKETQTVVVRVDRATPNSSHLIGDDVPFAADGLALLQGDSPAGITSERAMPDRHAGPMSDEEKIRSAAAAVVYQKYGTTISSEQQQAMIEQVAQVLNSDAELRSRIIHSMDQILRRER